MPKSKDVLEQKRRETLQSMSEALEKGNVEDSAKLLMQYQDEIANQLREEMNETISFNDNSILQSRGNRVLTQEERKYYEKVADAMKSNDYKQTLSDIHMPETIIEDVFKHLLDEHPILNHINFQNVSALTTWVLNDHTVQKAVWGDVTDAISKEIVSGFRTIKLDQYKLSAFFIVDNAMLDLGPTYLDAYVRTVLADAMSLGLEASIVTGDGKKGPIGMDRDISPSAAVKDGVYPRKKPVVVKSFLPAEYGKLLAPMAKTEKGRSRKFKEVLMICNMTDYLTKIMPATTVLNNIGTYVNNLFPFPTKVEVSNELSDGEAIVCLPEEYFFGLGMASKIDADDSVKFLEDKRAYRAKLHGNGRMDDNTCSLLLDISGLEPAYITVKQLSDAAAGETK